MYNVVPQVENFEVLEAEAQRLRAVNAVLQMELSVARRERDEWRRLAEQCGPFGDENENWVDTLDIEEDCLCAAC